jgi:serine/threonine-protein kinase
MTATHAEPVELQVLGPIRVTRGRGDATRSLVTQPRRLAVLAYLAVARPRGLHSRDTLIALLWSESDHASGRHALRNALHGARQALGESAIATAGDNLVGLDEERVRCDAIALESAVQGRDWRRALDLYQGEFLQGFHVSEAPEFERWLEAERRRLHSLVSDAAAALVEERRAADDHAGALAAAQRGLELSPDSEAAMRRVLELSRAAGDRAAVLRTYDDFTRRMRADLDVEPSAETQRLARTLRQAAGDSTIELRMPVARSEPPSREAPSSDPTPVRIPSDPHALRRSKRGRTATIVAGIALAAAAILSGHRTTAEERPRPRLDAARAEEQRHAAVALGAELPVRWRVDTVLLDRYLRAEANLRLQRIPEARESLRVLTVEAPRYAPAWSGLSHAISLSGFVDIPPRDASTISRATALRAQALDSALVENQYALIAYEMFMNWDLPTTRRRLDSAFARYPNDAELSNILAAWHRWNGRLDDAVAMKQRALSMDPTSVFYAEQVAWNLYLSHRCAEAAERYRTLALGYDAAASAYFALYRARRCMGRNEDAIDALERSLRLNRNPDSALFVTARTPMEREKARRALFRKWLDRQELARRQSWLPANDIALNFAQLGEADSTMAWLDSMYTEHSWGLHTAPFDPAFDFLRGDPRFVKFVQSLPWHPSLTFVTSRAPHR